VSDVDDIDYNRIDDAETGDHAGTSGGEVAESARAVLVYLTRSVVDDPDSVVIEVEPGRDRVTLNVRVAPGDMGRVIGKRGRVANAIRTVTRAAAVRDGVEVDIEFLD
jgi:predicted RNA-binding protein YlqC (UPF0109 family)